MVHLLTLEVYHEASAAIHASKKVIQLIRELLRTSWWLLAVHNICYG